MAIAAFILAIIPVGGVAVEYQAGYDPAHGRPDGVREISDDAWGEEKNGLQAAISAPDEVRFNEEMRMQIVVRNVSAKPVRVVFPSVTMSAMIRPEGSSVS